VPDDWPASASPGLFLGLGLFTVADTAIRFSA
jgi:hypothetical protein